MKDKNIWQRFNPSLKEMTEKNPGLTVLGLWWAWFWRLLIIELIAWAVFALIFWFL